MPSLSKLPVTLDLTDQDLSPFSVDYINGTKKLIKTFKFLINLLHNQYDPKTLSPEEKKLLGRRKLYPDIDPIFQYEETYSWLLAATRTFYVRNSICYMSQYHLRKMEVHIDRYYYLINKYPQKVLTQHTDSPEHTYSLISSLV